jgi:DNA-binding response OmpR family regulator
MQLEPVPQLSIAPARPAPTTPLQIRVLVADASDDIRRQFKDDFMAADPTVAFFEAPDGRSALEILKRELIDLCLIDRKLPRADGPLLVREVQQPDLGTVFVLLSDKLISSWPEIACQIRAYEVLLKPPGPARVEKLLGVLRRMKAEARALVALESTALAAVVCRMLETTRFTLRVDVVHRGDAVLRRLGPSYDFVLLDTALPDMMGIEVAARIRAQDAQVGVIMTGRAAFPAQSFLRELGVSTYLRQPFDMFELENALHRVFGLWQPYLLSALQRSRARASSRVPA